MDTVARGASSFNGNAFKAMDVTRLPRQLQNLYVADGCASADARDAIDWWCMVKSH